MSFITEALTPEEQRAKEWSRLQREKEKSKRAKKDWEQKQQTYELKRERLDWQKKSQARNREERLEKEKKRQEQEANRGTSEINMPSISDEDRDPTAYKKAISGVASASKAALGAGSRAVIHVIKSRKAKKEQAAQQAAQKSIERQREKTQSAMKQSTRLLPGYFAGETPGQRARRDPEFRKRLAKQRMPQPPKPRSPLKHPDAPRTPPKIDTEIPKTTPQVSIDPTTGTYIARGRPISDEFSCWREEFLYELGEMRRKNKKDYNVDVDYIVDVGKDRNGNPVKNKITFGQKIKDTGLQESKGLRRTVRKGIQKVGRFIGKGMRRAEVPLLALSFAANAAQSPEALIRSGEVEQDGVQLMSIMMRKRKEADRNLDSGRVSHPARNIKKKEQVKEALDKEELLKAIVRKLIDEKKRKNTLLTKGYIGEAKYSKENLQCNKPKADPVGDSETGKSHVVKSCEGGTKKLIRFGQRGVKGSPKKKGESKAYANRRKRFKARHAKNIAKGKMSASWWSNSVKW